MAAEAGVGIADLAIESMSSCSGFSSTTNGTPLAMPDSESMKPMKTNIGNVSIGYQLKSLIAAGMSATAPTTPMKMNARFTSFLPAVCPAVVMSSRAPRPVNVCAWSRRGSAQLRTIAAETAIRSFVTLLMF